VEGEFEGGGEGEVLMGFECLGCGGVGGGCSAWMLVWVWMIHRCVLCWRAVMFCLKGQMPSS